jgi:hypothetical protein
MPRANRSPSLRACGSIGLPILAVTLLGLCAGGAPQALAQAGPRAAVQAHAPAAPVPQFAIDFTNPWSDPVEFPPTPLTARLRACLPVRLHPVSRQFLQQWLAGEIGTRTFRRFFHMPNSAYLPVAECLVRERTALQAEAAGRYST